MTLTSVMEVLGVMKFKRSFHDSFQFYHCLPLSLLDQTFDLFIYLTKKIYLYNDLFIYYLFIVLWSDINDYLALFKTRAARWRKVVLHLFLHRALRLHKVHCMVGKPRWSSLQRVHVKISPSCTVAHPSTLYLETRASLCVYFTSVCLCVVDVRMKLSKSTDVVIRANVCLWVFCRHLVKNKVTTVSYSEDDSEGWLNCFELKCLFRHSITQCRFVHILIC